MNKKTKIVLSLTDDELFELYCFVKGITIQSENSDIAIVSMSYSVAKAIDKVATTEMKAEVSISIQAMLNVMEKDVVGVQNFQNGLMDLVEQQQEEKLKLEDDIDNLMGNK